MKNILSELYIHAVGVAPDGMTRILGSGSARSYYRLTGPETLIGTIGTNRAENEAFLYLDRHFAEAGINVPRVVAVSDDSMAYLQQDLGDTSLFNIISRDGLDSPTTLGLLRETMAKLPDIQFEGARNLDFNRCFPVPSVDFRSIMWDLNYFKYCFLKIAGIEFDESALEDDFVRLAEILAADIGDTFMYRDFQSRNVMVFNDRPWFIDFQGGRRGPCLYDSASFLWQARARFPDELRRELAGVYLDSVRRYRDYDTDDFYRSLRLYALFRTLQVLGAYGLRGLHELKAHFIESIPDAVANLTALGDDIERLLPELHAVIMRLSAVELFRPAAKGDSLVVEVNSFGFRAGGIPRDYSGNGGGYVFDCRAITNPGRLDEYKPLTGLDAPVKEFLEADGEVFKFLDNAKAMVGNSVRRYLDRGFQSLKVSFGCTGGRHRSVYCAQAMAEYLNREFGVAVELHHRERNIHQSFPSR